jgi:hypothetical protein
LLGPILGKNLVCVNNLKLECFPDVYSQLQLLVVTSDRLKMSKVYQVILLIFATAHANVTMSKQEHNVSKREIDPQIIGGSPMSMPSAVLILIKPDENTTNSCSGTILSEDIILSAGHCFDIPGGYANVTTIVAGVSDLRNYLTGEPNIAKVFTVERVTIHPHYRYVDGGPGKAYLGPGNNTSQFQDENRNQPQYGGCHASAPRNETPGEKSIGGRLGEA